MLVLKVSTTHGVGVFTTAAIAQGEYLRLWQPDDWRFVPYAQAQSDPDVREFKDIYCVRVEGGYNCPLDFCRMSVGWYMDHADAPNVDYSVERNYEYFAMRDIESGEEILCDYRTLSPYERAPGD
jgi:SET domain-containing protein